MCSKKTLDEGGVVGAGQLHCGPYDTLSRMAQAAPSISGSVGPATIGIRFTILCTGEWYYEHRDEKLY